MCVNISLYDHECIHPSGFININDWIACPSEIGGGKPVKQMFDGSGEWGIALQPKIRRLTAVKAATAANSQKTNLGILVTPA